MLQLTANGIFLDIQDVSFNLTLRSAISGSAGSFVYSFSIPYSPKNAEAFGFPYRLSRFQVQTTEQPGELLFNGKTMLTGTWRAKSTNGKTIKLEMLIGSGEFNNLVDGKNLPEFFDIETTVADIVAHVNGQVSKTWPEVNHNFPTIFNPKFYGDPTSDDNPNPDFAGFINNFAAGVFIHNTVNDNTIVPQLYLLYIIKRLFEANGYSAFGPAFQDTMLKKEILYNNYALDLIIPRYSYYGESSNAGYYSGSVDPFFTLIFANENVVQSDDVYDGLIGKYTILAIGDTEAIVTLKIKALEGQYTGTLIASIRIMKEATEIAFGSGEISDSEDTEFTVQSAVEPFEVADIGDQIWLEIRVENQGHPVGESDWCFFILTDVKFSINNITQSKMNSYMDEINYKNHVPDTDVKEFFAGICSSVKILPVFNHSQKSVELLFLKNIFISTATQDISEGLYRDSLNIETNSYSGFKYGFKFEGPDDLINNNFVGVDALTVVAEVDKWTNIPANAALGAVYFIRSVNAWYRRSYNEDTATWFWEAIMDNIQPYVHGDGKEEISSILAPMLMRCEEHAAGIRRNTPAISAQGTSKAFSLVNEFPLRIMFWVGLVSGGNGLYPFASTIKYDKDFNEVLPMNWLPEEIVSNYLQEFIAWLKRRQYIEFTLDMLPDFMDAFNFSEKTIFENTETLFEEIYIKISNRSFGPGSFKGWGG